MDPFNFKPIKESVAKNGCYSLKKNIPIKVRSEDSSMVFEIHEDHAGDQGEISDEYVAITSNLSENDYAIFSKEYLPRELNSEGSKKADIMCLFFVESKGLVRSYAYEMKHAVGNSENVIFDMIEQCAATTAYCKSLYDLYKSINHSKNLLERHVGVVTWSLLEDDLQNWIDSRRKNSVFSIGDNYFEQKMSTQSVENNRRLEILEKFKNRRVEIDGMELPFDIRVATGNHAEMKFIDGRLV